MTKPAIGSILPPAVFALVLSSAFAARAGPGSAAETERNRFSFHPSIQITAAGDDNVHLSDSHTRSDAGAFVLPRIELGYQGSWFDLGADLGADIRRYIDAGSPSEEFFRASGFAELGLLPGLTLRFSNAYIPTPADLGKPEDHSANLVQINQSAVSVQYWRELPGEREMQISLQGTRLGSESFVAELGNGVVDDDFHADFWEATLAGEIQNPLSDRASAFLRTDVRYRSFDDSSAQDFGDLAVLVGVRTKWSQSVDFDVACGYGRLTFGSGGKDRFLAQTKLIYRMPGGTILRLSFQNRNIADIVGNDFIETTGRIGVEHRFGERTAASIDLFVSRLDNEIWSTGANLFGGMEVNIRRQLTRRTQLAFIYRYWDNGGDYGVDDFRSNRVSLVLSYRR